MERDFENRRSIASIILGILNEEIVLMVKSHFHICGYVNKYNFIYWKPETLQLHHQRPFHSTRVSVAVWHDIFEEDRNTVSGSSARYVTTNENFVQLQQLKNDPQIICVLRDIFP